MKLIKIMVKEVYELGKAEMTTHADEKLTGAFRFHTDWHIHEGPVLGAAMTGKPFDRFEQCSDCRGNVRYCFRALPARGLPNIGPSSVRREWEAQRQQFADISARCTCDPEGDKPFALEYDHRPFSISFDARAPLPDTRKIVANFLEGKINQMIEGLEKLRKRIR